MSAKHEFAGSRFSGRKTNTSKPNMTDSSFIVASIEAGNTTTKCILTSTDLKTGMTEIIGKSVRLTRGIQKPSDESEIFGKTLGGTALTRETLAELVKETISEALFEVNMTVDDVSFVVRSTGVTAACGKQLEMIILALAEGCLLAGFSPRKMTGYLSLDNMPDQLKPYSYLDSVYFDGAVAGVRPLAVSGEGIISNEMESELALAGMKEAAKHIGTDFRNPCIVIDMGTTLSGKIAGAGYPYAETIASFCGYAGAVADALVQSIDPNKKSAYEFIQLKNEIHSRDENDFSNEESRLSKDEISLSEMILREIESAKNEIMQSVHVMRIPDNREHFGPFLVNMTAAKEAGLILFGCDVGENGSDFEKLSAVGKKIYDLGGMDAVSSLSDSVMAEIAVLLIECISNEGLLLEEALIGITGGAGTTGKKKEMVIQNLKTRNIMAEPEKKIIFAENGLARGAAVMARCMNSLGCPKNPIGGKSGGTCVMKERRAFQNTR